MLKKNCLKLTFILYDGIKNSVFTSQVLQPLLNRLEQDNKLEITLVSFEKKRPSNEFLIKTIPAHNRLHLVICRRIPFFGKISLKFAYYQLKKLFKIMPSEKIIARGPLAGWIALSAIKKNFKSIKTKISQIPTLNIQARGLCAQEHRFATQDVKQNIFKKLFNIFIYNKLNQIEYEIYKDQKNNLPFNIKLESVSSALKEYLINKFEADPAKISIATKDIPKSISLKEKNIYRKQIRKKLSIPTNAFVYCYSGSLKPWQCIPETIEYFAKEYKKNPKSFLLILSPDKNGIKKLLEQQNILPKAYALLSVDQEKLSTYLAACDAGILFRDKDIINWVSRPTKMLEYQAAGLNIIHNNTVECLSKPHFSQSKQRPKQRSTCYTVNF